MVYIYEAAVALTWIKPRRIRYHILVFVIFTITAAGTAFTKGRIFG